MQAIAQAIGFLLGKIVALAKFIGALVVAMFVAGWDFITDAFTWCFEQIIKLVVAAISTIDTSGLVGTISSNSAIPADIANALGAVGFGAAFSIIFAAIGIRFVLQLIPFTRLGS